MPRQGLGNSAIAAVANDEQLERFKGTWAATFTLNLVVVQTQQLFVQQQPKMVMITS